MSEMNRYIRDHVIAMRDPANAKPAGLTARQYRAWRRQLRRLWDGLPREMRREQ